MTIDQGAQIAELEKKDRGTKEIWLLLENHKRNLKNIPSTHNPEGRMLLSAVWFGALVVGLYRIAGRGSG